MAERSNDFHTPYTVDHAASCCLRSSLRFLSWLVHHLFTQSIVIHAITSRFWCKESGQRNTSSRYKTQHNNPSHNISGRIITLLTTLHHPFYFQTLRHLVLVVVELRIQLAVNHITQGKLFHQHLPRRYDPDSLLYTTRSLIIWSLPRTLQTKNSWQRNKRVRERCGRKT